MGGRGQIAVRGGRERGGVSGRGRDDGKGK